MKKRWVYMLGTAALALAVVIATIIYDAIQVLSARPPAWW